MDEVEAHRRSRNEAFASVYLGAVCGILFGAIFGFAMMFVPHCYGGLSDCEATHDR